MKFSNNINNILTNLTPPKIKSLPKFPAHVQIAISLRTKWIPTNEDSKFKSDCAESKDGYIMLTDVINFKLRLINLAYIFETFSMCFTQKQVWERNSAFLNYRCYLHVPAENQSI